MINANRDTSGETLQQHKEESHERFRVEFANAVEQKLIDFEMTWEELSEQLDWECTTDEVKLTVKMGMLTTEDMNDLAHVFSCEPYIILRPRLPWVQS